MTNFQAAQSPATRLTATRQVLIIDAQVDDYQQLVAGAQPGIETYILKAHQDGVEQITTILQSLESADSRPLALHIVSHGAPGCLYLGNTELSLSTLETYAAELSTWFSAAAGELLLYGCSVAAGDAGAEFLAKLHHLTGANLAASTRKIGQGTWHLNTAFPTQNSKLKTPPPPIHPHPLSSYPRGGRSGYNLWHRRHRHHRHRLQ